LPAEGDEDYRTSRQFGKKIRISQPKEGVKRETCPTIVFKILVEASWCFVCSYGNIVDPIDENSKPGSPCPFSNRQYIVFWL